MGRRGCLVALCYAVGMPQIYATDARLIALAPEFEELDPAFRAVWLDFTEQMVDLVFWGECAEAAHFLVTAHFLETLPSGGLDGEGTGEETGPLTAESDGPASRSFAGPSSSTGGAAGWSSSSYGRKYLLLQTKVRPLGSIVSVRSGFNKGMSRVPRIHRRGRRLY